MPTDKELSCLKRCSSGGYHHALPTSCQECCQQPALGCEPIKDILSTESLSSKVTPLFLVVLMQWLIDTGLSRPGCPSQAPDLRLCAPGASVRQVSLLNFFLLPTSLPFPLLHKCGSKGTASWISCMPGSISAVRPTASYSLARAISPVGNLINSFVQLQACSRHTPHYSLSSYRV